MSLPASIHTPQDADAYVAYSVRELIALLRGSPDPLVSASALRLEMRLQGALTTPARQRGAEPGEATKDRDDSRAPAAPP